jgi:hypothetical protein
MSLEKGREFRIEGRVIGGAERKLPSARERPQRRRDASPFHPLSRREEFRDDFTAIRHRHALAGAHLSNVLA